VIIINYVFIEKEQLEDLVTLQIRVQFSILSCILACILGYWLVIKKLILHDYILHPLILPNT